MLISILTAIAVGGLVYKAETTIDGAIQLKKAGNNLLSQAGIDGSMLKAFQPAAQQTTAQPITTPVTTPVPTDDNAEDIFCEECIEAAEEDIDVIPPEEEQPQQTQTQKKKKK